MLKLTNFFMLVVISILFLHIKPLLSEDASFYYFTRKNVNKFIEIKFSQINSSINLIDTTKNSAFIVHGFDSDPNRTNLINIKDGLLKIEDVNVFMVDWSDGADKGLNYLKAVSNVKLTGDQIGQFIKLTGLDPKTVHCIGHSLGAHVCGFAGKYNKLKRISGMDPAGIYKIKNIMINLKLLNFGNKGPLFSNVDQSQRLDKSDADFVDATHTSFVLGIQKSIGHKDFYVNGGDVQPGCTFFTDPLVIRCYHTRSIYLYAESITTNCSFKSVPCDSFNNFKRGACKCDPSIGCSSMGYRANLNNQNGDFYLLTNSKSPFCIE